MKKRPPQCEIRSASKRKIKSNLKQKKTTNKRDLGRTKVNQKKIKDPVEQKPNSELQAPIKMVQGIDRTLRDRINSHNKKDADIEEKTMHLVWSRQDEAYFIPLDSDKLDELIKPFITAENEKGHWEYHNEYPILKDVLLQSDPSHLKVCINNIPFKRKVKSTEDQQKKVDFILAIYQTRKPSSPKELTIPLTKEENSEDGCEKVLCHSSLDIIAKLDDGALDKLNLAAPPLKLSKYYTLPGNIYQMTFLRQKYFSKFFRNKNKALPSKQSEQPTVSKYSLEMENRFLNHLKESMIQKIKNKIEQSVSKYVFS